MEDRRFYVYEWYIVEQKEVFYVGKGTGRRYKVINGRNKFFLCMYNSHNCAVRIIQDNLLESEAFELEIERIAYYRKNTNFRLTNVSDGGEGPAGYVPSEEQRLKTSESSKKRWADESFRAKMMEMRTKEDSVYKSEEFRKKISELVKGEKNPNYGNHWSQEQKDHLSKVRKENGLAVGVNNPTATKIICLETGEVFDLIKDAMAKYNRTCGCFSVALRQRQKTAAGYHWMKYESRLENEEERFHELLIQYSYEQRRKPIICIQTKEIFQDIAKFLHSVSVDVQIARNRVENHELITINQLDYMCVNDYLQVAYPGDRI